MMAWGGKGKKQERDGNCGWKREYGGSQGGGVVRLIQSEGIKSPKQSKEIGFKLLMHFAVTCSIRQFCALGEG